MRQSSSCTSLRESTRQSTRRSSNTGSSRRSRSADRRSTTGDGPRQSTLRSSTTSTRRSDSINNIQVKKSFKDKEKQDCLEPSDRRRRMSV
jgi:hypothetical protein